MSDTYIPSGGVWTWHQTEQKLWRHSIKDRRQIAGTIRALLAALKDADGLLRAIAEGYPDIAADTRVSKQIEREAALIAEVEK